MHRVYAKKKGEGLAETGSATGALAIVVPLIVNFMGVSVTTARRWDTLHKLAVTNKGHEKKKHGISFHKRNRQTMTNDPCSNVTGSKPKREECN